MLIDTNGGTRFKPKRSEEDRARGGGPGYLGGEDTNSRNEKILSVSEHSLVQRKATRNGVRSLQGYRGKGVNCRTTLPSIKKKRLGATKKVGLNGRKKTLNNREKKEEEGFGRDHL